MFTPSNIVVFILMVGAGILIWIARRASLKPREDALRTHDHESPPCAGQIEAHVETNHHTGSCESKMNAPPCNDK